MSADVIPKHTSATPVIRMAWIDNEGMQHSQLFEEPGLFTVPPTKFSAVFINGVGPVGIPPSRQFYIWPGVGIRRIEGTE